MMQVQPKKKKKKKKKRLEVGHWAGVEGEEPKVR